MLYCNLHNSCGFGNLLFIISNGLSLSYDYNISVNFIDYNPTRFDRPNLKNYKIFDSINLTNNIPNNIISNTINIKEYIDFCYNKIILNSSQDYHLTGYFQSYKYFIHNIDKIKQQLFTSIRDLINETRHYFNNLKKDKKTIFSKKKLFHYDSFKIEL